MKQWVNKKNPSVAKSDAKGRFVFENCKPSVRSTNENRGVHYSVTKMAVYEFCIAQKPTPRQ